MRSLGYGGVVAILFLITLAGATSATNPQQVQVNPRRAAIIFLDGSTQNVEDLRFVYIWIHEGGAQRYRTVSANLHYKEMVRGVELDRVIAGQNLTRIELSWPRPAPDQFVPSHATITLSDGQTVKVELGFSFGATSAFLLSKPVEQMTHDVKLSQLNLEGAATVDGQPGRFSARLWISGGRLLDSSEVVKEVVVVSQADPIRQTPRTRPAAPKAPDVTTFGKVTFFDGSTQEVNDLKFVYTWAYDSHMRYINYQTRKTISPDFHYKEVVRGVELDRVIAGQHITRIQVLWPTKSEDAGIIPPELIVFTLDDGTKSERRTCDAASTFLTSKTSDQFISPLANPVEDLIDTNLRQLDIEGIATADGQRGKFSAKLWWTSYAKAADPKLNEATRNKAIKDVVVGRR